MKKFVRLLAVLVLLLLAAGVYAGYRLTRPYAGFREPVFLEVTRGTSTATLAAELERLGVVQHRWDFLLARVFQRRTLQAGEYRFAKQATPLDVYSRIARGDTFYLELVVPEGRNLFDIADLVQEIGICPRDKFLAVARNPALISDLDPSATSLEGYLFPNTYRVNRKTTPERLCRTMTAKFREVWIGLKSKADVHDTVTLASLVEKEGKLPQERPIIAAVFANRLRKGIKLDCDPTTIYAALLDDRYRGKIYRSDLDNEHAYNTYRHRGLPPGPIANPGLASLRAAITPADSDALFFVARPDGSGGHHFSNNIHDHSASVAAYRRGTQQ